MLGVLLLPDLGKAPQRSGLLSCLRQIVGFDHRQSPSASMSCREVTKLNFSHVFHFLGELAGNENDGKYGCNRSEQVLDPEGNSNAV